MPVSKKKKKRRAGVPEFLPDLPGAAPGLGHNKGPTFEGWEAKNSRRKRMLAVLRKPVHIISRTY